MNVGACCEWRGATLPKGYGYFYASGRMYYAHRVAYELANGPIADGHVVRHRCDNPRCVRPSHLLAGTQKDNLRDMAERGRGHKSSRPPEIIDAILKERASGKKLNDLAAEYGIPRTTIGRWARSRTKTTVPDIAETAAAMASI